MKDRNPNNEVIEEEMDQAYLRITNLVRRMYPVGSMVEFEHGNSLLVGEVMGYPWHFGEVGSVVVRIAKRDGSGTYIKRVSPVFSKMILIAKPGKGAK